MWTPAPAGLERVHGLTHERSPYERFDRYARIHRYVRVIPELRSAIALASRNPYPGVGIDEQLVVGIRKLEETIARRPSTIGIPN